MAEAVKIGAPMVNGVPLNGNKTGAQLGLADRPTIVELETSETRIKLQDNTIYVFGEGREVPEIVVAEATEPDAALICELVFLSLNDSPSTQFDSTGIDCVYYGDDCEDGMFTPVAKKQYVIMYMYDTVGYRAYISANDAASNS